MIMWRGGRRGTGGEDVAEDRGGVDYCGEYLGVCRAEAKGTMCGRAATWLPGATT